jgi:hypothetical protein
MIRLTITPAAFEAIASTLPFGSVAVEPERAPDGGVGIWLDYATVAKLRGCAALAVASPTSFWRWRRMSGFESRFIGVIGANPTGTQEGTGRSRALYQAFLPELSSRSQSRYPRGGRD